MTFFKKHAKPIGITIRVLIALIGGFILANLIGIIISYLPADNKVDGIVKGMMIGFIVYWCAARIVTTRLGSARMARGATIHAPSISGAWAG